MRFFPALALLLKTVSALHANPIYSAFTASRNRWNAHTTISLPNSTAFENATERWNSHDQPTYSLAITPATEQDVATAVKVARSINFPFLATGGRHSSSVTLGSLDNGLAIDLSALDGVHVDAEAGTLTIGGGTRFGAILDPVYNAGYQMRMVGATVGGGIGRYQGVDGLIIDSLVSVHLVTADGELIHVSNASHPDLYWAIRGAGPNFGIITSATYRLHPLLNNGQVLSADFILPASVNGTYFDLLQDLQGTMPAELATISIIGYNETTDETQILVNWAYIGPEETGRALIAPLFDLNPSQSAVSVVQYNTLIDTSLWGLGANLCTPTSLAGYGVNFRNLSSSAYQEVFQILHEFYIDYPDGRGSSVEIEVFAPQAVETVASDATAYPWRDTLGYTGISFSWNSPETEQAGIAASDAVRSAFVATSGYDDLAVYVSYAHGDETLEQLFGENVPRLLQLKREWDPDNVFRFFHDLA